MNISLEIKDRVNSRIEECYSIAERHYNRLFPRPEVKYDVKGLVAGYASIRHNVIRLNPAFLLNETEAFIKRTVAHECAHLICDNMHPEVHLRQYKGQKTSPHGSEWKSVMRVLGVDSTRTHNYDVSMIATRRSHFQYKSMCCGKMFVVGPKRHTKLLMNPGAYVCKCAAHGRIEFVPRVNESGVVPRQAKTKLDQARDLYHVNAGKSRSEIINVFMTSLLISSAHASTYYYKIKKEM